MPTLFLLGFVQIILLFLLFGYLVARSAKKHGRSPLLYGGSVVILLWVFTWKHIPRLSGIV